VPDPTTRNSELQVLTIEDFTPGIWRDVYGKQNGTDARGPAPDGAATEDRTYACASLPQGGITGGPKPLSTITMDAGWGKGYEQKLESGSIWAGGTFTSETAPRTFVNFPSSGQPEGWFMSNHKFDDPPVADWRLMDFEVIGSAQVGHSFWGGADFEAGEGWEDIPGATRDMANELFSGVIVGGVWNCVGTHNSAGNVWVNPEIAGDNCGIQASNFNMQFFPEEYYDGTVSPTDTIIDIFRQSHCWAYPDDITIHATQKTFGFSSITSGFFYNNLTGDQGLYHTWKLGAPVMYVNHCHTSSGSLSYCVNPNGGEGNWTIRQDWHNGNVVTVVGAIKPEDRGTYGFDIGGTHQGLFYVHHLITHAGRVIECVAPASPGGIGYAGGGDDGSSSSNSINEPPARGPGMQLWRGDDDGIKGVVTPNNAQLHYSYPQVVGWEYSDGEVGWKTGVADGKNLLGLSDEGYTIINSITSVNANQIFATTVNKGAVVVNGDLNNPNVVNLPSVESTYGKTPHPVTVNGGVVYGSRSGMFLWDGGETSTSLSPQLDGEFWLSDDMEDSYRPAAPVGRLGYRAPYLFVPNGWMCDMRTNSWWKIPGPNLGQFAEEAERWTHFRTDHDGYVWAGAAQQVADLDEWQITTLDPDETADYWRWHSQPLSMSRNKTIRIREITLWASGTYMTIKVFSKGVQQSVTQTITCDSDTYPAPHVLDFNLTGANFEIEVEAVGAGIVHKIDVGWEEDRSIQAINPAAVT